MFKHKVGDIVLADLGFDYELGIIVNVTSDAYMPYTVRWFSTNQYGHFSAKSISRFKKDFKKIHKS